MSAFGLLFLTSLGRREEVVAAERFELIDAEGRVRAEMAIDEDGSAGFFVRDDEGRLRATLIHDPHQAAMYLVDEDGTTGARHPCRSSSKTQGSPPGDSREIVSRSPWRR